MSPYLLNVDFELSSLFDLSILASELKDKIEVLVNEKVDGEYCLNFEISTNGNGQDPAKVIDMFFDLINNLSDNSRDIISKCNKRIIDLGYCSGSDGWLYNTIPNSILKKTSEGNFQLNISLYGDAGQKLQN